MKYTIDIEETRKFFHEIKIEVDKNLNEKELNNILDKAEKEAKNFNEWEAIESSLKNQGVKVIKVTEGYDPTIENIEIIDYEEE